MARTKVPQKEIRTLTAKIELRSVGDGDNQREVIEGYALKFNKWSDTLGCWLPFREKIMPGALDGCDMSNVVATFNHDQNMPLARNTISSGIGSLELSIDGIGLHFRCIPTNTSYANDLKENIRSNVVNQCSFAFNIDYEDDTADDIQFNEQDDIYERTINKIQTLSDVSVVTTPAYPDTEAVVGQRCKDKIEELRKKKQNRGSTSDEEDEDECACENCNHSDNCQSSGAKCCICCNCSMASECSKPGSDGCKCNQCSMAENNCCQPSSDNCLCNTCQNTDCKKGHIDNTVSSSASMSGVQMNNKKTNDELRKKLLLKTYL